VPAADYVSMLMSAKARNRGDERTQQLPTPRSIDMTFMRPDKYY